MKREVTAADGVPIRYWTAGAGSPALIFVHCWGGHHRYWESAITSLRDRYAIVALDLAGHGESGRGRIHPGVDTFADDVVAVARDANLSRAIVVGHSMGGAVAVEAARRLSDVAIGVVLVDTMLAVEQPMKPDERNAVIAGLRADFPTAAAAFMRQHLFAPSTSAAIVQRVVADATRADAGPAVDALDSLWRYDRARALEALDVPVRAINADLAPTDVAGNRRHARDYEAVILRGVGHYPMLEIPDAFDAPSVK